MKTARHLIVLNGTSSTGKTSTARQLQYLLGPNYLYISMDHFLEMLSPQACNLDASSADFLQPNKGIYASKRVDGTFDIEVGPLGKKMFHDMYDAVEVFLKHGWNVIFTVVQTLKKDVQEIQLKFRPYNPYLVYLYAHEEVIAQREKYRGNRLVGHTVNLLSKYTSQDLHDLKIDTENVTPKEVAEKIVSQMSD